MSSHSTTTATTAAVSAPSQSRVGWVDTGKGLSILGVVLFHVTIMADAYTGAAGEISDLLTPVRMPLFFLLAGLFSHRVLTMHIGTLFRRRLWFYLVPYLAWTVISQLVHWARGASHGLPAAVEYLVLPVTGLWFLYALFVFNVVAWLTRKLPPLVAIVASFLPLLGVLSPTLAEHWIYTHIAVYLPIFMIGVHGRELFFAVARHAREPLILTAAAGSFLLSYSGYRMLEFELQAILTPEQATVTLYFVQTGRAILALLAVVVLAVLLSDTGWIGRGLARIGRNTLPIYLVNELVAILFVFHFRDTIEALVPWLYSPFMPRSLVILLICCACVGVGWLVKRLSEVPIAGWIVVPPALPEPGQRNTAAATRP